MEENNNINIEEQWLDVPGYEGLYRVSSQGRVMSCVFSYLGHCRILRQCKTQGGYPTVRLTKNHQPKTLFVHRLVA